MKRALRFQLLALVVVPALLAGTLAELRTVADQWSVELTTIGRSSGKLRMTTIWFVHEDGRIYVQSGQGGETNWYRNLRKNPEVRMRFGDLVFEGRATPIEDPKETGRIHELFLDKYWTARISSWFGGGFGTGKAVRIDLVTTAPRGSPPSGDGAGASGASRPAPRSE